MSMSNGPLRKGDWVEVRSPGEILTTLDAHGALEGLPFMPEMVESCGRRYEVHSRTEKICDTINWTGSRRLHDGVFLNDDPRCSGSGHDGCQALCRIVWKEAWLRKVTREAPLPPAIVESERQALLQLVAAHTRRTVSGSGGQQVKWRCQATDLPLATTSLSTFDPRPYLREYTSGNVPLSRFVRVTAKAIVQEPMRKLGLIPDVHLAGPAERAPAAPPLNLQPGELVRVKGKAAIQATLNSKGFNRGLWFDREMMRYCGGLYRVKRRVNHFIDDRTAEMVDLRTEAVILEDVVCSGDCSLRRWFCARKIYPWWRECWLERVEQPAAETRAVVQA